jgi:hypothetical protein
MALLWKMVGRRSGAFEKTMRAVAKCASGSRSALICGCFCKPEADAGVPAECDDAIRVAAPI